MAEFDYDIMQKDIIDYTWDWDASFFGRHKLNYLIKRWALD